MRIIICTMEDPVYTVPFIQEIIRARPADICTVVVASGNRMTIGKRRSKAAYLLSLLLIMGTGQFIRHLFTTVGFRTRLVAARWVPWVSSPSLVDFARSFGIPAYRVTRVTAPEVVARLRALEPDVIINQTQEILKRDFLSLARLGVLNRHNALLPRNRGRLTPFWVAFKGENETGVSIHFVDEGIDSGPIVVQKRFEVLPSDDFNSIARKNYERAAAAMLEALACLERGDVALLENDDTQATYNTVPTLAQAWQYRRRRLPLRPMAYRHST